MSIKERLAMFEANARSTNVKTGPAPKITVLDEGNVKELREKAKLRATQGFQDLSEPILEDSKTLQAQNDKLDAIERKETFDSLLDVRPEAQPEPIRQVTLKRAETGVEESKGNEPVKEEDGISFIQMIFDSFVTRKQQEDGSSN